MITCLFSGGVAGFGLYLLSLCAAKAPHRRASFFAVAEMTFPRAAVFFDAAIAIKCFGVSIRYVHMFNISSAAVDSRCIMKLLDYCQISDAECCGRLVSRSYVS